MSIYLNGTKVKFLTDNKIRAYSGVAAYNNGTVYIIVPGKYSLEQLSERFINGVIKFKIDDNETQNLFAFDCSQIKLTAFLATFFDSSGNATCDYGGYINNTVKENEWVTEICIPFDIWLVVNVTSNIEYSVTLKEVE